MLLQSGENYFVEARRVGMGMRAEMECGDARGHRAVEHHRVGVVADDHAWLGIEAALAAHIEDRLYVTPSVRGEKSQPQFHRASIIGRQRFSRTCYSIAVAEMVS